MRQPRYFRNLPGSEAAVRTDICLPPAELIVAGLVEREPAVDQRLIHGDLGGPIDVAGFVDHADRAGKGGVAHHAGVHFVPKLDEFQREPQRQRLVTIGDSQRAFRGANLLISILGICPLQPHLAGFSPGLHFDQHRRFGSGRPYRCPSR